MRPKHAKRTPDQALRQVIKENPDVLKNEILQAIGTTSPRPHPSTKAIQDRYYSLLGGRRRFSYSEQAQSIERVANTFLHRLGFNKWNAPELISQLMATLNKFGLDEVVQLMKRYKVPQTINDAWQQREKTAAGQEDWFEEMIVEQGLLINQVFRQTGQEYALVFAYYIAEESNWHSLMRTALLGDGMTPMPVKVQNLVGRVFERLDYSLESAAALIVGLLRKAGDRRTSEAIKSYALKDLG